MQKILNKKNSDLIGVGRIFYKLKKDMCPIKEDGDKHLIVRYGSPYLRPTRFVNQRGLIFNRPNGMLKWLANEFKGLRMLSWVPQSFSYKLETGSSSRKLILRFEEEGTKVVHKDEMMVPF